MEMMFIGGLIAQSVEHRPFKAVVPGSSPGQPTIFFVFIKFSDTHSGKVFRLSGVREVRFSMSNVCSVCGKKKFEGGHIIRRGLAKKDGGIGLHVVKTNKRTFQPNIQNVRIKVNGQTKTVKMCTACIRTGNYVKA